VDEALLKNALAGDMVTDGVGGSGAFGGSDNGIPGMLMSLRTTIREICKRFLASLFETYSRADNSCGGSCLMSRREGPASSGDDMYCFEIGIMKVFSQYW
jgi:hypothetical protein